MLKSKSTTLAAILASLAAMSQSEPPKRVPNIHESASMRAGRKANSGDKLWRKARKGRLGMATLR